jgi:large repetitive protein
VKPAKLAIPGSTRHTRRCAAPLAAAAILLLGLAGISPRALGAQPNLNATKFQPSSHSHDVLATKLTNIPKGLRLHVGLLMHYSQNDLVIIDERGAKPVDHRVVAERLMADLWGGVSFLNRFSVGLLLPVALANSGEKGFSALTLDEGGGLGDVDLSFKAVLLGRDPEANGMGIGLALDGRLPTGNEGAWLGDDKAQIFPQVLVDASLFGAQAALNLGYRLRGAFLIDEFSVDDEIDMKLGVESPRVLDSVSFLGQWNVSTVAKEFLSDRNSNYSELDLGVRYRDERGLGILLGGGFGMTEGYGNVRFRLFFAASFDPSLAEPDEDGDGIYDKNDSCIDEAEDYDGFEDTDGCPDPDNDGDGVKDFEDVCPGDREDVDGFEDSDGCPEFDNDGDGIADTSDVCPVDPEDIDGFEDKDGCPDADNDNDGILDLDDACPDKPETMNGHKDMDGCPDRLAKVEIKGKKIIIRERVFFATNKAKIKEESYSLLDDVAALLEKHPEVRRLKVEGHTDNVGRRKYNVKLSNKRAGAVARYLIGKGINRSRLSWHGYGPDSPITTNDTEEGRGINRRVEFTILDIEVPSKD